MKKERSFRHVVLKNLGIGYCIVLVTLGIYTRYLYMNYNSAIRETGNATMNVYLHELHKGMDAVENKVYSWYLQDNMGLSLELSKDSLRRYLIAYNFYQLFREEIAREENIKAAFLLYDDYHSVRFSAKTDFDDRKIQKLKTVMKNISADTKETGRTGNWLLFSYQEENYLVYSFGRQGVLLAEVLDYEALTSDIVGRYNSNDVSIVYADPEKALNNKELAEKLSLPDEIDNKNNSRNGYYIFWKDIVDTQLTLYLLLPYRKSLLWQTQTNFVIAIIFITFISVLLSYHMFRREMIKPLLGMTKTLKKIGEENSKEKMSEDMNLQEYNEFGRTFNQMVSQIGELRIKAYEEQIDRDKAKLQSLQLQIKPHFYLNSLTTLFALSQQKRYDKLENNILTISDYMRYSFKDSFSPVPLREELKFVEDTVTIRRDSYNRGIKVYQDVDKQLLEEYVLPLSIQTFVENSMKYANPNGSLAIHIHVSKLSGEDGNYMDIVVSDNGQGYPPEWISRINNSQEGNDDETHIGIFNLKKRLMLEYGDKVEFVVRNSNGAVSEIIYPIDR